VRLPVDIDLAIFVYTVCKIVFLGLPRLRRNAHKIPLYYQMEEVGAGILTEAQANYLAPFDEKLNAMNYWPACTYRVRNYGHNLIRSYVNPMETSRCVVIIHELAFRKGGKRTVANSATLSFHTCFTDGTIFTTRNMHLKSVMDRPPYQIVQECPGVTDPAEMKRKHDSRVSSMGCPTAPPSGAASTFKDVQAEHARFSAYQISQGSFRLSPDGTSYVLTDKVFWRGIRNHLNPFVHRFSVRRFLPAALIAMALPLFAVLRLASAAADAARTIGFPPDVAAQAVTIACYMIAGALIGYVLERQTFVWVFLLTYLTVRIVFGGPLGTLPYSAFAGSVAYSVAQTKKHRRAVLIPQRA
jgi:hypothetical protein